MALKAGINRLRTKGGASPESLYHLINGYVNTAQGLEARPGTVSIAELPVATRGLFGYRDLLQTFGDTSEPVPPGFALNLVRFPFAPGYMGSTGALVKIHYVAPVIGKLYVVAEFTAGVVVHYWLDDPGAWKPDTMYFEGGRVRPIVDNGLAYEVYDPAPPPNWQVLTPPPPSKVLVTYNIGTSVQPTLHNGFKYTLTESNDAVVGSASYAENVEPEWPTTDGATVLTTQDDANDWLPETPRGLGYAANPAGYPRRRYVVTTAGVTGTAEPTWSSTVGVTVTDGTVVYTVYKANTITWQASVLYKSGSVEPAWVDTPGSLVADGAFQWKVTAKNITDPNCPQTKEVIVAAGKVFAGDDDVTRYSATTSPRDWTTANDAGFLPTGLQAQGSQRVTGLGSYRGNLVVWTSSTSQIWNVDPDPAEMSLFDVLESAGMTQYKAHAAVDNDLYWLSPLGVRSISIAAGSTNLQAGDIGTPVDSLVRASIAANPGVTPQGFYFPGQGQFWLSIGSDAYVYTRSFEGSIGAWSLYTFPAAINDVAQLNGELYARTGNVVRRFDKTLDSDDGVQIQGVVWWPHLDFGNFGVTKRMAGFDLVAKGTVSVQFGANQNDPNELTAPYAIDADTLTGGIIPFPLAAPSISTKLNLTGQWSVDAASLYLSDMRMTS